MKDIILQAFHFCCVLWMKSCCKKKKKKEHDAHFSLVLMTTASSGPWLAVFVYLFMHLFISSLSVTLWSVGVNCEKKERERNRERKNEMRIWGRYHNRASKSRPHKIHTLHKARVKKRHKRQTNQGIISVCTLEKD